MDPKELYRFKTYIENYEYTHDVKLTHVRKHYNQMISSCDSNDPVEDDVDRVVVTLDFNSAVDKLREFYSGEHTIDLQQEIEHLHDNKVYIAHQPTKDAYENMLRHMYIATELQRLLKIPDHAQIKTILTDYTPYTVHMDIDLSSFPE